VKMRALLGRVGGRIGELKKGGDGGRMIEGEEGEREREKLRDVMDVL
jgi:hypothetical protein